MPNILIADDEKEIVRLLKIYLETDGVTAAGPAEKHVITVGDVRLDLDECMLTAGGRTESLTKTEFKVLELLMSQPRRVFTKEQIYESAWYDDGAVDDNTIRVIISRLRDKVGSGHTKTIRGLGYRFEE